MEGHQLLTFSNQRCAVAQPAPLPKTTLLYWPRLTKVEELCHRGYRCTCAGTGRGGRKRSRVTLTERHNIIVNLFGGDFFARLARSS